MLICSITSPLTTREYHQQIPTTKWWNVSLFFFYFFWVNRILIKLQTSSSLHKSTQYVLNKQYSVRNRPLPNILGQPAIWPSICLKISNLSPLLESITELLTVNSWYSHKTILEKCIVWYFLGKVKNIFTCYFYIFLNKYKLGIIGKNTTVQLGSWHCKSCTSPIILINHKLHLTQQGIGLSHNVCLTNWEHFI